MAQHRILPVTTGSAQPIRTEADKVCELVLSAAHLDLQRKPGPQLAELIQSIFGVEAVAIFDGDLEEIYQAGPWFVGLEDTIRSVFIFETVRDDPETGLIRRVLRVRDLPIGALLLRGQTSELTATNIASLVSITFDRYHALAGEIRMENAKRAEELRTTVLDSLAHAYKTPLTAIQAASSGLQEMGHLTPAQSSLVALISEQAELLNHLTTRLLRTARLDRQSLHTERVAIAALIEDVVAGAREQLACLSVRIVVEREDLAVIGDRGLLNAMLTQFVDNAGKYAFSGSTVTIAAAEQGAEILLSVHNAGSAIPPEDHERIFDRYFRSTPEHHAPGTGIGLSVAKQAAQAHGGRVWVTSEEREGTTFFAALPAMPQGGQA
ncbi:MAG TPA: ATP-binding protein [Acidobacteriaceae bacterium]|nr:ATP-binding protein [Acidobacteriaceae bacterium]